MTLSKTTAAGLFSAAALTCALLVSGAVSAGLPSGTAAASAPSAHAGAAAAAVAAPQDDTPWG